MSNNVLSASEYAEKDGNRCTGCGSDKLEGFGTYDADADYITHSIECLECGAAWDDLYKLVGYLDFVPGKAKTDEREIE